MICRLCLKEIAQTINIFDETGIELNVAAVLTKYFWFEPKCDDPISTCICNFCWIKVSSFHEFYTSVEQSHRMLAERFSYKDVSSKERTERYEKYSLNAASTILQLDEYENQLNLLLKDQHESALVSDNDDLEDQNKVAVSLGGASADDDDDTFLGKILETTNKTIKEFNQELDLPEICNLRRSTRTSHAKNENAKSSKSGKTPKQQTDTKIRASKKSRGRQTKQEEEKTDALESREISDEAKTQEVDEKITQFLRLTCDICAIEKLTFAQIRLHMKSSHSCKGYVVCCNKKFYKRVLLVDHIERHLNPDYFKCNDCNKVFADKQCMRNHFLLKHQPEEKKTFHCEHCSKRFAKAYLLEQHRVVHEARTHICEICQKGFPSDPLLYNHIKMIHSNYGTMCDICAKVIRGRAAFSKHQQEHTGVTIPKVQCDKCGSWHKDKYSLQKHKRRHNEEGTLHVCTTCGKVAPNRSALLSHQRYVHASARIFECSVCKKAFKKAINLKEHMAIHTGEVLYHCSHCPKTFNSNANMHSHRKKMHPKEFEDSRIKRREKASKTEGEPMIPKTTAVSSADAVNMHSPILVLNGIEEEVKNMLVKTDFSFNIN